MFLSVIIPVYNGAGTISRCLDSIWNQGLDEGEYEVICVDDCSTDNTVALISELEKQHANLRLLLNEENLRAGGSRNHGVKEAKGEYVVFIDADDYYHPGSLKEAVEYLKYCKLDVLMCDSSRELPGIPSVELVHRCLDRSILTGRDFCWQMVSLLLLGSSFLEGS